MAQPCQEEQAYPALLEVRNESNNPTVTDETIHTNKDNFKLLSVGKLFYKNNVREKKTRGGEIKKIEISIPEQIL